MQIIDSPLELRNALKSTGNKSIGFVPTMGALHKGHLSLIEKAGSETEIAVVSIFVNPTQFNNSKDLASYPKLINEDIQLLKSMNVDYLFLPAYEELYADNYNYKVVENELSKELCGEFRPGHFTGVLTIVMKLLNIVNPDKAYFGEKDYQQLILVKKMVEAFFMDVKIIGCPTIREEDGLALSSRNLRLTSEERAKAKIFPELLKSNLTNEQIIKELNNSGFKVDYIKSKFGRRLGAAYLGNVRLIDNVEKKNIN